MALADLKVADRVAEMRALAEAAERGESPGAEAAVQFRAFMERDPDWPKLYYEFWAHGVRNAPIQAKFAERRRAVRDALAETLERVAAELGFRLRFPAPQLATAIGAALNGLAFERAADPQAVPEEVFEEFIAAVLACSVAAPGEQPERGG